MDLTGYTWVGNNSLNITNTSELFYNVNGSYEFPNGGISGTFISLSYVNAFIDPGYMAMLNVTNFGLYAGSWNGPAPAVIQFTGGTDATNPTLIAWLEANGTLTAPATPSGKTKLGTLNIAKKMFGTLPIVKEVVDGMVVYEKQSTPTYQVEVYDSYGGSPVYVYDGTNNTATLLGDAGAGRITVDVTSGHLFLETTLGWRYSGSSPRITVTGDVSLDSYTNTTATFTVVGTGSITTAALD